MQTHSYPILDPDYSYHTMISEDSLYHFFKALSKPNQIHKMTSIFLEYGVSPYTFEKNPQFYKHISSYLVDKLKTYLNYSNFNILCHHNMLYLVLFNIDEEQLNHSLCQFHHYLKEHSFLYHEKECRFLMKCGIYHSHNFIDPYQFYEHAYSLYLNTHQYNDSFLSVQQCLR